jgi:hypothetical protein
MAIINRLSSRKKPFTVLFRPINMDIDLNHTFQIPQDHAAGHMIEIIRNHQAQKYVQ